MIFVVIIIGVVGVGYAESPDATPPDSRMEVSERTMNADWALHPPVVDGDLSDWNSQQKLYLSGANADYPAGIEVFPSEDFSGWASVSWSTHRVYLAFSVTDDYVVGGSRTWHADDMVSIVFDADNSGNFTAGDVLIAAYPNNMVTVNGGWPAGFDWAIHETAHGWQGEISFPQSVFTGIDFLGGHKMGFTWGIQDNDGIGVESWMSWAGSEFTIPTPGEGVLTFTNGPVRKWVAFHPGVNGYDGIVDSSLDAWHPTQNHGADQHLYLYARNQYHLVLKFDIPDLGSDVRILDARVHINFTGRNHDWTSYVRAYRLLRPWDEAAVTWRQADATTAWGRAGANAIGSDRESRRIATKTLNHLGWYTFDLPADVVVDMYEHPENNHGIIFRAEEGSSVNYIMASTEAGSENAPWIEVYAEFPPDQGN